VRALTKTGFGQSQGVVMLWVDIFTQRDSLKYPPVAISGPVKAKFEIRIVCWRTAGIKVPRERMLDLFATFFMDGDQKNKQSTDTHWRCKTGTGSWNWRIKIPIELPISAREKGRLRIQLWNRSVVTSNRIIGETAVNLYDWFMLAYRRQTVPVHPFKVSVVV
jgi:hypothetical protein